MEAVVNYHFPDYRMVNNGVPERYVLGPLLFIFIIDLDVWVQATFPKFTGYAEFGSMLQNILV